MFLRSLSLSKFSQQNLATWLSMAFQGGAINAGGFLACHRFVTHTTGFATYFGTEFANGQWIGAFGMLSVPLFFLVGAMISGFFVDRKLAMGQQPLYHWMFASISVSMIFIAIAGSLGIFGEFGAPLALGRDYSLLALLCLCSGIQNATITSASGAVVRTTHLTGITTDLGIGLVRVIASGQDATTKKTETRANWMRFGLVISFILGSTFSAVLFYRFQYLAFLGPALISTVLTVRTFRRQSPLVGIKCGDKNARAS